MTRYSDIRRGAQLNEALTNYVQYLTTPRTPKTNTRGARPAQQQVFVLPYSIDLGTDQVVAVKSPTEGVNRLVPLINNTTDTQAEVLTAKGSKTPVVIQGFSPARLVTFENTTRSVTVATSDITKSKYLKYAGDRYQCAFGKKAANDDINDAFNILLAAAKARTGLEVNRVSMQPERISRR
jgi:hypothetical protein